MLTEDQIASWQAALEREQVDADWASFTEKWLADRSPSTLGALRGHLQAYLHGDIALPEFQSNFDRKTRKAWDIFGLKGTSGAMFLNTLVKYMPDQKAVDGALKASLPLPGDPSSAGQQITTVVDLINEATSAGQVAKIHVQAARAPFFLSAWWHIQDRDPWPIYYISMRHVFEQRGIWKAQQTDPAADYVTFRQTTMELRQALDVGQWDLERLCLWLDRPKKANGLKPTPPQPPPSKKTQILPIEEMVDKGVEGTAHTQVQLLLAKLGKKFNCKVWIAQNDHGKHWAGEKLGAYSIPALPTLGIGDPAQSIVRMIDVIWLKGVNQVVAAFEIEHTTSIFSGLLRMSDLTVLAPNTHFPIYIVAPETKLDRVRDQLRRPTFQHLELHQRCRYFSIEQLIESAPHMLKWAGHPAVIDELAEQVDDVNLDSLSVTDEVMNEV